MFGKRAAQAILDDDRGGKPLEGEPPVGRYFPELEAEDACRRVGEWMWEGAGVVRGRAGLQRLLARLGGLTASLGPGEPTRRGAEAHNLLTVALLIARLALWRRESRGAHFRSDFPRKRARFRRHSREVGEPRAAARAGRRRARRGVSR